MWSRAEIFRNKVIFALIGADAFLFYYFDKNPDYFGFITSIAVFVIFIAAAKYYYSSRKEIKIATAFKATAHLILYTCVGSIFNHLLVLTGRPLIDGILASWDRALGFYWPEFIVKAQSIAWLDWISSVAYNSSLPQIAVVVLVLSFSGRQEKLDKVLNAFVISSLITILFWAMYPLFGSFVYYSLTDEVSAIPGLVVDRANVDQILQYRSNNWDTLRMDRLTGLIAFPSFHTVMAVLTIYAFWNVRFVFLPVFLLNVLVLISVPIDGGHHLVDVAAGIIVASLVIAFVEGRFARALKFLVSNKQSKVRSSA
ncbi:phosphatase PAP2 family protein [Pseudovibrio sp. Tun.PSC04-5.I4]|uniref:phosphatase PAP2 family protein n=1 Tax=Pseudovibrio sp. Tun.PSC04-5.I4 TaxID=1798213 RepID=UPI00087F31FB|nr:phosphatase PAP2 family protein [Pseudovibrio sp. Tun.PSC04-5.I4]SDR48335.1 PAP2 superfamily protein [Pseudovibrio sp. Tun.PSC04-5.I4]